MKSLHFARCYGKLVTEKIGNVRIKKTANKCSCRHIIQPKEYHVMVLVENILPGGTRVWKKKLLCKTCIMKKLNSWIKDIQEFRDTVLHYTDPELYQKSKNSLKRNKWRTNDTKR